MLRKSLIISILALMAAFWAVGCSTPGEPEELVYGGGNTQPDDGTYEPLVTVGVDVGDEAPDFTLADTYGDNVTLTELRDEPVLLYFWATGCQYCVEQNVRIQEFYENFGDTMTVLAVNIGDDPQLINAYLAERGLTFPCVVATGAMQTAYGANSVPNALVIDPAGVVTFNDHPGYLTEVKLQEQL
jgi:peroxiredoxin